MACLNAVLSLGVLEDYEFDEFIRIGEVIFLPIKPSPIEPCRRSKAIEGRRGLIGEGRAISKIYSRCCYWFCSRLRLRSSQLNPAATSVDDEGVD